MENGEGYQVFTNAEVVVATAATAPSVPVAMDEEQIEAFQELPEVLTEELIIPVQFTPVEAQAMLENAREAAVDREVQSGELQISFTPASDASDDPGNNTPLGAAKPANSGPTSERASNNSEPRASVSPKSDENRQDKTPKDKAPKGKVGKDEASKDKFCD